MILKLSVKVIQNAKPLPASCTVQEIQMLVGLARLTEVGEVGWDVVLYPLFFLHLIFPLDVPQSVKILPCLSSRLSVSLILVHVRQAWCGIMPACIMNLLTNYIE